MCINEQGKTSKSVWDKGPVHFHLPPRKKEKKRSDCMETEGNEAFT